jgi:hypothetical protein
MHAMNEKGRTKTIDHLGLALLILLSIQLVTTMLSLGVESAAAQSFNIDFGTAATAPPPSYAAAGIAGTWNVVGVLPPGQRQDLVDVNGTPGSARIYQVGGTAMLDTDDPLLTGDHAALLEDMFISFNNPLDACIWIERLQNGSYEVLTYALTPNDPNLQSRVRVDDGDPGAIMVGGAWPGAHAHAVSYARHTVTITNGVIGLHSGLPQAQIQSGINGIQVRPLTGAGLENPTAPLLPENLVAYPNPARRFQEQTIEINLRHAGRFRLTIVDAAGRLVHAHELSDVLPGRHRLVWDGRSDGGLGLPAGIYFINVVGGNEFESAKLLRLD